MQILRTIGKRAIFLVFGLLIFEHAICLETTSPKIAVIGGGIGGATASHFLTELMNGNLDIDLFESRRIGGRLATVKIGNEEYEAGGSIIHSKNMYMQRFVELLGLEHKFLDKQYMGIWNGDEFVFKDDSCSLITWMKLLYRYGFQVYKLKRDVNDTIGKFMKIYELQNAGMSFANITSLLSAVHEEFPKWLQTSMKDRFLQMGYSEKVIDELTKAAIVVNYGQDTDVQSFVGFVSLAADSDAWSVKGGNKRVPEQLIRKNKNVSVVSARVTKIRYMGNGDKRYQYEVTFSGEDGTGITSTDKYDIVIIAAPLTNDQESPIKFVNFPEDLEFPGSYQTIYTTFVKADIKLEYFDLRESLDILSCNPNKTKINSVARQNPVDESIGNDSPIWKIFSKEPLGKDLTRKMFSNIIEEKMVVWKAYPHYLSTTRHSSFKLHDAMYHVNAIEWIASAMEMSAIGGRNVAILAYNNFLQKHGLASAEAAPNIPKKVFYNEEI